MPKYSLVELITLADRPFAKPEAVADAIPPCLMDLHTRDLPQSLVLSVEDNLHRIVPLLQVAWGPYSALADWRHGHSRCATAQGQLRRLLNQLRAYIPLLVQRPQAGADGYTALVLKTYADLTKYKWQEIRLGAKIRQTGRGKRSRLFSNLEIRALIGSAEAIGKAWAREAARKWQELLDDAMQWFRQGAA